MAISIPNALSLASKYNCPWLIGKMNDSSAKTGKMQYKHKTSYCARKQRSVQKMVGAYQKGQASLIRDNMKSK